MAGIGPEVFEPVAKRHAIGSADHEDFGVLIARGERMLVSRHRIAARFCRGFEAYVDIDAAKAERAHARSKRSASWPRLGPTQRTKGAVFELRSRLEHSRVARDNLRMQCHGRFR